MQVRSLVEIFLPHFTTLIFLKPLVKSKSIANVSVFMTD